MRLSSALLAKSAPHPRTHSRRNCTSNTPKWLAGPRRRPQDVAGIFRESLLRLLTPCSFVKNVCRGWRVWTSENLAHLFFDSHSRAKILTSELALSHIDTHCHTLLHIVAIKFFVSDKTMLLELFSTNYNDSSGNPELSSTIVDEYYGRQE